MGLYPQPNNWQCGPFALKHALIMLGQIVDEREVSRIARTHWWSGTDEIKLGRAAHRYGCELKLIRRKNPLRARRELLVALKRGSPALLCVDGWNHWITVVGAERGKFISIDSRKQPVVCVDTWRALKHRWVYREVDEDDPTNTEELYDLHLVIPRTRARSKARFSLRAARYLRRPENRIFASHWDEYFTDLLRICTPRTPRSERILRMGELLRRHGAVIRNQVAYWHGVVKPRAVERQLRNLRFVADTYDLVVRQDDEKRAIVAITANLSLWAASKFGVDEVYGNS
ncbi:MAG: hypothetical protein WB626_06995 [Bacteroidota bacterium]